MQTNNQEEFKDMYSGDSKLINAYITDENGNELNLTDAILTYVLNLKTPVKKDNQFIGGLSVIDAEKGKILISIDKIDTEGITGNYYHWVEMTDANGKVSTVYHDLLTIKRK